MDAPLKDPIMRIQDEKVFEEGRVEYLNRKDLVERMKADLGVGSGRWSDIPWVTPVLGSGPLGLPLDFLTVADTIPDLILSRIHRSSLLKELLRSANRGWDSEDPEDWVKKFIRALVAQRAGDEYVATFGTQISAKAVANSALPDIEISDLTLLLALIAGQLTRTYHRVRLDSSGPFGRWGTVRAQMHPDHPRFEAVAVEYLSLLRAAITRAHGLIAQTPQSGNDVEALTLRAVDSLLAQVSQGLADSITIYVSHIQQLTEVAWRWLVEAVSPQAYPGWTDLLLHLVLVDDVSMHHGHNRPRWYAIEDVARRIRDIMLISTESAWREVDQTEEGRENRDFYNSVADCLWSEHLARATHKRRFRLHGEPPQLPEAIAFATSFDVELEMALWRMAPAEGGAFSIVLPTYAVESKHSKEADFVWLEAVVQIPPSHQITDTDSGAIEQLLRQAVLKPSAWHVMHNGRRTQMPEHPIVVHLAGCPLVELPSFADPDPEAIGAVNTLQAELEALNLSPVDRLVHSVAVDEYLAFRQTEAEWLWNKHSQKETEDGGRGLPTSFTHDMNGEPTRFWVVMGVPLRDPALRLRVLSVLGRDTAEPRPEPAPEPTHPQSGGAEESALSHYVATPTRHIGLPPRRPSVGATAGQAGLDRHRHRPARALGQRGVAINTRTDDDEVILLTALGIATIRDRCERFTSDLSEYCRWLGEETAHLYSGAELLAAETGSQGGFA